MGAVNFNDVKTSSNSPLGCGTKSLYCLVDLVDRHFLDRRKRLRIKWDGTGPPYIVRPPTNVLVGNEAVILLSVPGRQGASFPPRVGELDTGLVALGMNKVCDALEGSHLGVLPEASVFGGDSTVGLDTGGLEDGEGSAAHAERPQVDEVPVGEVAMVGRVLALEEEFGKW